MVMGLPLGSSCAKARAVSRRAGRKGRQRRIIEYLVLYLSPGERDPEVARRPGGPPYYDGGMQTPWGELEVIDAHVHFFSPNFFLSLASQCKKTPDAMEQALGWQFPLQPEELADTWAAELDPHGVARAALIASVPGDEHSVAAAVKRHPDRFYGYFMLNPTAGDAVDRAARAFANGLRGVCLFPAMHRYPVHD